MTLQNELDDVLDKHENFVNRQRDGERAELSKMDLSGESLQGVNLSAADPSKSEVLMTDFSLASR